MAATSATTAFGFSPSKARRSSSSSSYLQLRKKMAATSATTAFGFSPSKPRRKTQRIHLRLVAAFVL
jgi:hypothetical protein